MDGPPITVVETGTFASRADRLMTTAEREAAIDMIAADPDCGDLIVGGGDVRIVYYFRHLAMPVFLLTVFAKIERANLNRAEINELAQAPKARAWAHGG